MGRKRNSTCRICLRFGSEVEKIFKSLFEIHNCSTILDNLTLIADVKIEEDDGLPDKICGECLSELDAAINFKEKCERSNKLLHSVNENEEEKSNTLPGAEFAIPIELVKKEDISEDCIQYEVEYYDDAENDFQIKSESDHTDNELATEVKPELETEESDVAVATSDIHQPDLKKSKAIDLKLICDDCGGSFKSKCKLRVHWKKVHMAEKLICNYCKRAFKSFIPLHKHLKKRPKNCLLASETRIEGIGKSRVYNCRRCHYTTKRSHELEVHFNTHTGNRPFICNLCSKGYSQQCALDSHKEMVHKIIKKAITCQYCGQFVMGRHKIRQHLDKHTRTSLQCDICKKMFKSKQIMVNHLKHHSGVKAYTCDKCGAAFYTNTTLTAHKRCQHSVKIYFKCDICGFKVLKKSSLKKHQIKHTNSNVACGVCGRFYPDDEELASHQKLHTKEKSECLECNRIFSNERSLKRHKIETHKHKKNSSKQNSKQIKNDPDLVKDCKE